jgi:hypothetical protein
LNGSQYLGPSNPGVVFKANPLNDWEYPQLRADSLDLNNLAGFFVTATTNQVITGTKTFTSIPIIPTASNVGTNLQQATNREYVSTEIGIATSAINAAINGDQIVTGNKNFVGNNVHGGFNEFTGITRVPYSTLNTDAVNGQRLSDAIDSKIRVTGNCVRVGNIQTIYGSCLFTGQWAAGGNLSISPQPYTNYAANMQPFTSVISCSSSLDRLAVLQTIYDITAIAFVADTPSGFTPQPDNGIVSWQVVGYV